MNDSYLTIRSTGSDEVTIQKSRFIGLAAPCSSEEEAQAFIRSIREKYRDARHCCYAYIIGVNSGVMRYSDDGEPGGTAGMPMMDVLKNEGIVNCCVAVVRYFGGIKLGAGGLIRAYSGAVSQAAANASKTEEITVKKYRVRYPYDLSGTLEGWLRRNTEIIDLQYDEAVTAWILSDREDTEDAVRNLSRGTVEAEYISTVTKEKDI